MNIGIDEDLVDGSVEALTKLLCSTYVLYVKTQYYHWNVTGPYFVSLHKMFEEQYNALAEAVDTIAERIRALGRVTPGTLHDFQTLSDVKERHCPMPAKDMIGDLMDSHETIARFIRDNFAAYEAASDEASIDLSVERLDYHEKTAWMLRSLLEEN